MKKNTKFEKIAKSLKNIWNWIWHSDSILSWIVALIIIYILVKWIFFPGLSLITGTSLPLAGVESSSMDHQIIEDDFNRLSLCGNIFSKKEKQYMDFDKYWETCGQWYIARNITKQKFMDFSLKDGFRKGDIIIVWGRFKPKIGDVIIFKPNLESTAPRPIIHRIVVINNGVIQTKGDHNEKQLTYSNNIYATDETKIEENQLIGKAIFRIPYLGWPKIWLTEAIKIIGSVFM